MATATKKINPTYKLSLSNEEACYLHDLLSEACSIKGVSELSTETKLRRGIHSALVEAKVQN